MTKPSPRHLLEIEHEGLELRDRHWTLRDYESEESVASSRLFYFTEETEGFVIYRQAVADVEIMNLAVRRKGCGFGKKLLTAFFQHLKNPSGEWGTLVSRILLEVRADNHAARRLYEFLGFRQIGHRRAYYRNGADALTYEKSL
jgi:ribosomal protein S18 acetylase RimI-like enzyme